MKKKLLLILAILFTATSIFAMKIYLTNSAGSGQAQADPNASLGGYRSTTELSATSMKNLFDDVSIVEALIGDTEYRMIDIYNDAATDALRVQFYTRTPTSSPDTALTYGYSATNQPHADSWNGEALANESTAPASPSMSFVDSTKTSPLAFGTIPAGSSARVCVKRVVSAGSAWTAHDIGSFGVRWGVAAVAAGGTEYLYPSGDHAAWYWEAGSASYQKVDEVYSSPNDTDYIESTTDYNYAMFTFTDTSAATGRTITDVSLHYRAKKTGAAGDTGLYICDSADNNLTLLTGSYGGVAASFTEYHVHMAENPITTDPWNSANTGDYQFNTYKFGIRNYGCTPTYGIQCSQMWLEVVYE